MKDPREIIDQLSPNDALMVLKTLAHDDERLAARIAEIAMAHLDAVDWEEVAFDLYQELEFLEVEEVWDRAGPTRHGVDAWKTGAPSRADVAAVKAFIEDELGGWGARWV